MSSPCEPLRAPLTFSPRFRKYVWGGRNLKRLFGRELPDGVIAESWEISAHPAAPTLVDHGPLAGRSLPNLVADYGVGLVGRRGERTVGPGKFPLLVKILDAHQALSVQVHPDDAYAGAHHPGEVGKTEMWYVLHATPGAEIIFGLAAGTDEAAFRRALAEDRVKDCLNRVPVRAGDSVLVPAGTVHAVLPGIVLVEVQQSSDITYRVYDWGRRAGSAAPRELHLDRAMDVIDFGRAGTAIRECRVIGEGGGVRREVIAECDEFVVERIGFEAGAVFEADLDGETFETWGVLSGSVSLATNAPPRQLDGVRFALLPAAMGAFGVTGTTAATALRIYLP